MIQLDSDVYVPQGEFPEFGSMKEAMAFAAGAWSVQLGKQGYSSSGIKVIPLESENSFRIDSAGDEELYLLDFNPEDGKWRLEGIP